MRRKTLSDNGDKNTRSETERIVPQQRYILVKIRENFEGDEELIKRE